jgi:hypothetical protein
MEARNVVRVSLEKAPGTLKGRTAQGRAGQSGMSYKFQRLREKIRTAIATGDLIGKLPGERALARRFHVNAKTLSKALTDLAAEGVLNRSIGRGTYVKGSVPDALEKGRWLVISDSGECDSSLVQTLRAVNPELQVNVGTADLRPSFLNQFDAVIDIASHTPDAFLRDLVVRNMPVVAVNREPNMYSMHSVLVDDALGAARLGRDLALVGHRRFAAVEPRGSTSTSVALRNAVKRYAPDAIVDACSADEVRMMVESGVTAVVCGSCAAAENVNTLLNRHGISVPGRVSLAAVGCIAEVAPCSGYFCAVRQLTEAVDQFLAESPGGRPATLWLAGAWHDGGTTAAAGSPSIDSSAKHLAGGVLI